MKQKIYYYLCFFLLGFDINAESENLEIFKNKWRDIYTQEISTNKNEQAFQSLYKLRESLPINEENKPYIAGITLMIYKYAKLSKNTFYLSEEIVNLYSKYKNEKFIYLDFYQADDKIVYDFWKFGIFFPTKNLELNVPFSTNELPSNENLKEIFDIASEYGSEFTGRLNGESSTTTYGDICIHLIYFNKQMPNSKKISELKRYTKILRGSGLGNVYLSLALLKKETKEIKLMKQYSKECIKILKNENYFNPYNNTKIQLCEEML